MDIYSLLPTELQNKVKYLVLEHPVAKIIKDEISRLRCNEYYTFRDKQGQLFCKIDGRDHFVGEYFLKYRGGTDSDTTDEYLDDVFHKMFFVSSSSDED